MSEEITVNDKIRNALDLYTQEAKKLLDEKFATKEALTEAVANALTDAEKAKLDSVEKGAQENIIEKIFVDGTEQLPDETKKVNISLADFAKKNSPTFTGTPTAPTVTDLDSLTDQLATVSFCNALIRRLVGTSPETLNTLQELAAAIHNDPNYATAVATELASKQAKSDALTSISTVTTGANEFLYTTEKDKFAKASITEHGRNILATKDSAETCELLNLETNKFAIDEVGNTWTKFGDNPPYFASGLKNLGTGWRIQPGGVLKLSNLIYLPADQPFTIECWVWFITAPTATTKIILLRPQPRDGRAWGLGTTPNSGNGKPLYCFFHRTEKGSWNDSTDMTIYTAQSAAPNSWYHLAQVYDGAGNVTTFVDGYRSQNAQATIAANYDNFFEVSIGGEVSDQTVGAASFDGYISRFRISSVARYTATFNRNYNQLVRDANTLVLFN